MHSYRLLKIVLVFTSREQNFLRFFFFRIFYCNQGIRKIKIIPHPKQMKNGKYMIDSVTWGLKCFAHSTICASTPEVLHQFGCRVPTQHWKRMLGNCLTYQEIISGMRYTRTKEINMTQQYLIKYCTGRTDEVKEAHYSSNVILVCKIVIVSAMRNSCAFSISLFSVV